MKVCNTAEYVRTLYHSSLLRRRFLSSSRCRQGQQAIYSVLRSISLVRRRVHHRGLPLVWRRNRHDTDMLSWLPSFIVIEQPKLKQIIATNSENAFDYDVMKLLQGSFIGLAERHCEFRGLVCLRDLQRLASERKAADEPHETFSCRSFLLPLLIFDKLFQSGGLSRSRIVSRADFLVVSY